MTIAEQIVDAGQMVMEQKGEVFKYVEGRAVPFSTWGDVGLFLERHAPGSFTQSLAKRWKLPLLFAHKHDQMPIGIAEQWESRSDGLWARWQIAPTAVGQEAAHWAREGGLGLSIGFQPVRSEWKFASQWDPTKGPEGMDRVTRLESRLLEVSLVPTPAFVDSVVDRVGADSLDGSNRSVVADFRCWLRSHRYV